ncbi:MAG TPA: hypothetical protein VF017_03840 [Thermoanaerobaculia bacterium]|nr:hypothetical protein [Thermoanaerobaculia bacterium]
MRAVCFVLFISLLCSPVLAVDPCLDEKMTVDECQHLLKLIALEGRPDKGKAAPAGESERRAATRSMAKAALAETSPKEAGSGADPYASNLAATLTDYLNVFGGAFEIESQAEDGRTLTLNLVPELLEKKPLKLQAVVRKPEIYGPLKEEIPEDVRGERSEGLEKKLRDFDDVEIVASYRLNRRDTRYVLDYDEVFAAVIEAGTEKELPALTELADHVDKILVEVQTRFREQPDKITLAQVREVLQTGERYQEFRQALEAEAAQLADFQAVVERVVATYFDPFANAVNNKTQWIASGSYRLRNEDGGVGPDQWKLNFRYEHGFLSNPEQLAEILEGCAGGSDACLDDLAGWTKHAGKHRLVASLDYEEVKPYGGTFAGTDIDLDSSHCLVFKLAYGLYLDPATKRRLALDVSYEDVSSDPMRQDRWLGSLVVSQQLESGMEVVIGAVYANHAKFLGEVDEPLSAHFGLNYSFKSKDDKK